MESRKIITMKPVTTMMAGAWTISAILTSASGVCGAQESVAIATEFVTLVLKIPKT
jgi:hypothetical protein